MLIFSQWRKTLTIIENFANQNQWKYCRLDGNTSIAARQKLVDKFNNDESYFCMLMTTRTGGVSSICTVWSHVLSEKILTLISFLVDRLASILLGQTESFSTIRIGIHRLMLRHARERGGLVKSVK